MNTQKRCDKHELGTVTYTTEVCPLCKKLEELKRKEYERSQYGLKPGIKSA
jgi:phage FluMu protein Com